MTVNRTYDCFVDAQHNKIHNKLHNSNSKSVVGIMSTNLLFHLAQLTYAQCTSHMRHQRQLHKQLHVVSTMLSLLDWCCCSSWYPEWRALMPRLKQAFTNLFNKKNDTAAMDNAALGSCTNNCKCNHRTRYRTYDCFVDAQHNKLHHKLHNGNSKSVVGIMSTNLLFHLAQLTYAQCTSHMRHQRQLHKQLHVVSTTLSLLDWCCCSSWYLTKKLATAANKLNIQLVYVMTGSTYNITNKQYTQFSTALEAHRLLPTSKASQLQQSWHN